MTPEPTKSRAERKLESLEDEMTPDDADQPDSLEVTFNHVRVDLPPEDRVGADDGDAADGDESGERHATADGNVVVDDDLDDYEHAPESVHAHYRFNPTTGRYDIPGDDGED